MIVQPLPINPNVPIGPTPTMVTTMVTSTKISVVEPTATTANPAPIPVTLYNLAQSKIQEIPNPPTEEVPRRGRPLHPNGDNPTKVQQPKATTTATATAPMTKYHASLY